MFSCSRESCRLSDVVASSSLRCAVFDREMGGNGEVSSFFSLGLARA